MGRRVFIDSSFVEVLLDRTDDRYDAARAVIDRLLLEFERSATLLYSHEGVVAAVGDDRASDVLKICDVVPLRRWLTRCAARVERAHPELGRRHAITVVLMRRWRIGEIASFDPFFAQHGIPSVPDNPDASSNDPSRR